MIDPEKLQTVAHLTALGKSQHEIARATGIPRTTVDRWQDRAEVVRVIDELRPAITARLSERLWKMVDDETQILTPMQLGTLWGISMDKHQKAEQPTTSNPTLVIVIPGINQPETIQGELA
jgi:hypothetical protein